jgi:hypothetical protein
MAEQRVVGLRAVELIGEILRAHPEIRWIRLFEPEPVPLAQARLPKDEVTRDIVARGIALRATYGTPFWDSVLVSCFGRGRAALPVLQQAQFHNLGRRRDLEVEADHWGAGLWTQLLGGLAPERMLVFSSQVRLHTGEERHLPLLDLHCPVSEQNEELATSASELMDIGGGFLLQSGDSYHFYGRQLLDGRALVRFLGQALLFAPVIDRAWIAHQLIEGACALRISNKPRGSGEPVVVRAI